MATPAKSDVQEMPRALETFSGSGDRGRVQEMPRALETFSSSGDRGRAQEMPRALETFSSSDDYQAYLQEAGHFRRNSDEAADDEPPPEDGEEELEWLKFTGYDSLVMEPEPEPGSDGLGSELSRDDWNTCWNSLSTRQAEAVRRRVNTLRDTLRRRPPQRARRPHMRQLFAEGASVGVGAEEARSRSATPDSLDCSSPPPTPPGGRARRQAGSPHSQGYHSSSRGSLDQLEQGGADDADPLTVHHVLKIAVGCEPPETSRAAPLLPEPSREAPLLPEPSREAPLPEVRLRQRSPDAVDQAHRTRSLFETSKQYKLNRLSAPANSTGVELRSVHHLSSLRRRSPPEALVSSLTDLAEFPRIPRVRSGSSGSTGSTGSPDHDAEKTASRVSFSGAAPATKDHLGRTVVDHLSDRDIKQVQKLALIELTALFDEHGVSYTRRKARRRRLLSRVNSAGGGEAAVFGASLPTLLERDRQRCGVGADGVDVPLVLERVIAHLERRGLGDEGLLRVPGHQHKVELLRRHVDQHFYTQIGAVEEALRRSSAADVAALVKLFLRELPQPLLTDECMDAFQKTDALPAGEQPRALNWLCLQLPAASRAVLRRLLRFLAAVVEKQQLNKMSLENVAMIMAPNLMWPTQRRQKDISAEIEFAAATSRVVRGLLRHRDRLWDVPDQLVHQVRQQHQLQAQERARKESSRPVREMKKLMRRTKDWPAASRADEERADAAGDRQIVVAAPDLTSQVWDVRVLPDHTAADVVLRCLQQLQTEVKAATRRGSIQKLEVCSVGGSSSCLGGELSAVLQRHFLYEYGGNIDRRRLEHDAALSACVRVNPAARWQIRCCHPAAEHARGVEFVAC